IEPGLPRIAAGQQNHVRVSTQVRGLLLGGASGEVNGTVEPYGNERGNVGSTVGPDGRDPEQLGSFEHLTGLIPSSVDRVRVAEPPVDLRDRFVRQRAPLPLPKPIAPRTDSCSVC